MPYASGNDKPRLADALLLLSLTPEAQSFLEAGARGLKNRSDPEERELTLARAKVGELTMRLELAEYLIEKRGFADEWKRSRR